MRFLTLEGSMSRFAVVTGAGGFIGGHLVERLKAEGYEVRAVSRRAPTYGAVEADEYEIHDLTDPDACREILRPRGGRRPDEVYQLAARMGGMGFIESAEADILQTSAQINLNLVQAACEAEIPRYFFASSVCVYRDMAHGEPPLAEADAYPARPANEYGWEKLYAERVLEAHARTYGFAARIGRFENTYGPRTAWRGGQEKAPAALCRKAAMAPDGGELEVWGDGDAVRNFTYIDDLVDGIRTLMRSDLEGPTNIGSDEYVTVAELADAVVAASGKHLSIAYVPGPVGVTSRNFSHERLKSTGWRAQTQVREGVKALYDWVAEQVATDGV
jgi:nucleoside-diphosphate-sugar epimerase